MIKISRIISAIFNPLVIPTYAMIIVLTTSILMVVPASSKYSVVGTTFAISCLMPLLAIFLLFKLRIVSDAGLNNQKERLIPYSITTICYLALAYYLIVIHSPAWLWAFVVGAAAATIISAVVNLWWKISAHAAAMGGLMAMTFLLMYFKLNVFDINWLFFAIVVAAGLVCTSRLILERHTLWQLLAGTLNGILCVSVAMMLAF